MIGRVSELHEDVNNTIFSITQDKLRFERKRVRSHEEESVESQKKKASSRKRIRDTLTDGTKIKKSAPLDLFPDDEDSSEEHSGEDNEQDDDEDVPAPEETLDSILSSQKKKRILPSGKNVVPEMAVEESSFVTTVESMICEQKANEASTEYNKGRKCDVRFLSALGVDIGEWEFASNLTAQKAIGDRCRSARINQSILNGLLNRNLNDKQAKKINVLFLQVADTSGQMLVEDLVEGFYVVFPGPTFETATYRKSKIGC
nr:3837_t:CDS:2 [Entrophospora candida]